MSTFIKGEDLILYVWDGTSAYEPVACLTSNSIELTRSIIESQTKCDPGVTVKSPGIMTYQIPFEGEYIVTESGKVSHDGLMDFINTASPATITWRMDTGQSGTPYYYGTGTLVDLSLSADAGDNISTFSGTIDGSGLALTTDPEA
jgi:hypothetical protein